MRIICSYCQRNIGEAAPRDSSGVTHGMCVGCAAHFERQWSGLDLRSYLDGLSEPVVVVDPQGRVITLNQAMEALLGRSEPACRGLLGGEVFDCVYARLPDGCGRTVHCTACAMRRAVEGAAQSGETASEQLVHLTRSSGPVSMRVTAERVDGGVRVSVHAVGDLSAESA